MFSLTCAYCENEFSRKKPKEPGRNAYCSAEHQRLGQRYGTAPAYSVSGPYAGQHICPACGTTFNPHHPAVVYCSKNCKSRAANARTVERYAARGVRPDNYDAKKRKDYKIFLLASTNQCPICKLNFDSLDLKQIHVDHDHLTGALRDILCSSCNQGLGNFKDNIELLEAAIEYLRKWNDE